MRLSGGGMAIACSLTPKSLLLDVENGMKQAARYTDGEKQGLGRSGNLFQVPQLVSHSGRSQQPHPSATRVSQKAAPTRYSPTQGGKEARRLGRRTRRQPAHFTPKSGGSTGGGAWFEMPRPPHPRATPNQGAWSRRRSRRRAALARSHCAHARARPWHLAWGLTARARPAPWPPVRAEAQVPRARRASGQEKGGGASLGLAPSLLVAPGSAGDTRARVRRGAA